MVKDVERKSSGHVLKQDKGANQDEKIRIGTRDVITAGFDDSSGKSSNLQKSRCKF